MSARPSALPLDDGGEPRAAPTGRRAFAETFKRLVDVARAAEPRTRRREPEEEMRLLRVVEDEASPRALLPSALPPTLKLPLRLPVEASARDDF